jgi:hypothetical protein
VVIAEATRRLLGNLFELKDLGASDLRGVAEPVRAWVALRASTVESRFEAMHPSGLTALVGRVAGTVDAGALETYPFRRDRFVLVVARGHPLAKRVRALPRS